MTDSSHIQCHITGPDPSERHRTKESEDLTATLPDLSPSAVSAV